jgi:hypothetical protein
LRVLRQIMIEGGRSRLLRAYYEKVRHHRVVSAILSA